MRYTKKTFCRIMTLFIVCALLCSCHSSKQSSEHTSNQSPTRQSEEIAITTEKPTEKKTEPLTEKPTETNEYTALELADKSLGEIIDIMGGDFEIEYNGKHLIYYTSGFCPENMMVSILWVFMIRRNMMITFLRT